MKRVEGAVERELWTKPISYHQHRRRKLNSGVSLLAVSQGLRIVPLLEIIARLLPRRIKVSMVEYFILALYHLKAQALRDMPCDMAMHKPCSRIVDVDRENEVT